MPATILGHSETSIRREFRTSLDLYLLKMLTPTERGSDPVLRQCSICSKKTSMIRIMPITIAERLRDHNQEHLLRTWDSLSPVLQESLSRQVEQIDFDLLENLIHGYGSVRNSCRAVGNTERVRSLSPTSCGYPDSPEQVAEWKSAADQGEELLRDGRVGVILVAGGQGTRRGSITPRKGMFPISPVAQKSLFQLLAEQLLATPRVAPRRRFPITL